MDRAFLLNPRQEAFVAGRAPRPVLPTVSPWSWLPLALLWAFACALAGYGLWPLWTRWGQPPPSPPNWALVLHAIVFVGGACLPGWFAGMLLAARQRVHRLARGGRLLPAEVVAADASADPEVPAFVISLRYRFTAPDGRVLEGFEQAVRQDLRGQPPPAPGARVLVWYADPRAFMAL